MRLSTDGTDPRAFLEFPRVKLCLTSMSTRVDRGVDSLCITVPAAVDNTRRVAPGSSEARDTVRP
jgi:hypothetical protein